MEKVSCSSIDPIWGSRRPVADQLYPAKKWKYGAYEKIGNIWRFRENKLLGLRDKRITLQLSLLQMWSLQMCLGIWQIKLSIWCSCIAKSVEASGGPVPLYIAMTAHSPIDAHAATLY